ncbi:MAG: FAD binding domain-containing protein [Acidobacteria bacterium]|nr:FAD binding domain-containing protein [Acidobacteriota bacterium]
MTLPAFTVLRPRTLSEALFRLQENPSQVRILAGGTDLLPSMRQRLFAPEYVLDIGGIRELKGIRQTEHGMEIGALTSLREIEHSCDLEQHYPLLVQAAKAVASPVIRNMATLAGNICLDTRCLWYNQSQAWRKSCGFCLKKDGNLCHVAPGGTKCWAVFAGDTPPALLCLEAEIEVMSAVGTERIPLRQLYTGEGDSYHRLQRNQLITRIILPSTSADLRGSYRKIRVRGSIDYPLAAVALALKGDEERIEVLRVALTAVNPAPTMVEGMAAAMRVATTPSEFAEVVAELAARTAKPLTTSALTPEYRREMIRLLARRAFLDVVVAGSGATIRTSSLR